MLRHSLRPSGPQPKQLSRSVLTELPLIYLNLLQAMLKPNELPQLPAVGSIIMDLRGNSDDGLVRVNFQTTISSTVVGIIPGSLRGEGQHHEQGENE